MTTPVRLAILASHPVQYQAPLWRELARRGVVAPEVIYLSRHGVETRRDPNFGVDFSWDVDLLSGYQSRFLWNLRERAAPGGAFSSLNPTVVAALREVGPAAVLFLGIRTPTSLAALAWARLHGVKTLYRAESSIMQLRSLRGLAVGAAVLRTFDAVLPVGTANDLYYQAAGIPERRRFLAPYSVDNDGFAARRVSRFAARGELGLGMDEFVILLSSKLVVWKDPLTLVEACGRLRAGARVRVLVAGDGPLRREFESRAAQLGVPLTMLGFVNQSRLSVAYSAADVLTLCSLDEPWGLVVNEAMCHGLPVLVSHAVGARLDLVRDGLNGSSFRAGDVGQLSALLARLLDADEIRSSWGAASTEIIRGWGLPQTAAGIEAGVEGVVVK